MDGRMNIWMVSGREERGRTEEGKERRWKGGRDKERGEGRAGCRELDDEDAVRTASFEFSVLARLAFFSPSRGELGRLAGRLAMLGWET